MSEQITQLKNQFTSIRGKIDRTRMDDAQKERLAASIQAITALLEQPNETMLTIAKNALEIIETTLSHAMAQEKEVKHYKALSETDELTGLPSRRAFNIQLDHAIEHSGTRIIEEDTNGTDGDRRNRSAQKRYFGVVLFDLDRFKSINDEHGGHVAGDKGLQAFANAISRTVRKEDDKILGGRGVLARIGGDEFAAILEVNADTYEDAQQKMEMALTRIRSELTGLSFEHDGKTIPVLASAGLHPINQDDTALTAYQAADDTTEKDKATKNTRYEAHMAALRATGKPNVVDLTPSDVLRAREMSSKADNSPSGPPTPSLEQ